MDTYEKKYNEALKRAKGILNVNPSRTELGNIMESIFPELRESEDEEIRQQLLWLCGQWEHNPDGRTIPADISNIRKIRNWLEKQKEQKPAEWSEEDKKHINLILRVLDIQQCWDGATGKRFNPYQDEIDWLKSLRPSWKPSEEQMEGLKFFLEFHRSQRNAGTVNWREYDAIESLYEQLKKL